MSSSRPSTGKSVANQAWQSMGTYTSFLHMPKCCHHWANPFADSKTCVHLAQVWHGRSHQSGQQIGRSVGQQNQLTSSCIWISTGVQVPVFEFNMHQLSISCSVTQRQSTACCNKKLAWQLWPLHIAFYENHKQGVDQQRTRARQNALDRCTCIQNTASETGKHKLLVQKLNIAS